MTCNPSMVRPAGAAALASVRAASLRGRHRLRAPPGVPAHARRADVHMPLHVPHRGGKHVPRDVGALPADAGARRRWHTMNLETPLRSPCLPAHFHLACLRISTSVAQWAPPLSAYLRLSPPIWQGKRLLRECISGLASVSPVNLVDHQVLTATTSPPVPSDSAWPCSALNLTCTSPAPRLHLTHTLRGPYGPARSS